MSDGGGEGEESGGDAGVDAGDGFATVVFEGGLVFEGVEDGLDLLSYLAELAESGFRVFAVGADQVCAEIVGGEGFELVVCEVLVADDGLPGLDQVTVVVPECLGDFSLAVLRVRRFPDDRYPVGGAEQVEPEFPRRIGSGRCSTRSRRARPDRSGSRSLVTSRTAAGSGRNARRTLTIPGDFPHGSGVGSTGRGSSSREGVSWVSSVVTADSSPVDCRTCLPHPDCPGRPGNMLIITITATFVGLSRQTREHAFQMRVCVPEPLPIRCDPE